MPRISEDEKTLLNCSDRDIAVVSQSDHHIPGHDPTEDETLEIAMSVGKPVIAVKDPDLARDVAFWLKIGKYYQRASFLSAAGSCASSAVGFVRLSKILAISSAVLGAVYCTAWHWDPIYHRYHLLENPRLLSLLGSRYRRGTNIVLIKNHRSLTFWVPMMTPVFALCLAYGVPLLLN